MEALYELKDLLCDQVEEIVQKNDITPTELDRVYKVVDVIKDICTIDAMENAEYDDYSMDSYESYARGGRGGSRASGRSNASYRSSRRSMEGGGSNRGSYRMYRDDGYSGHTKEQMLQKIEEMKREIEQM